MEIIAHREVPLSNGGVALIDEADWPLVSGRTWRRSEFGYALAATMRSVGGVKHRERFRMHRVIVGDIPEGMEVDHINRNRLDNRRANLRIVTVSANRQNKTSANGSTSKYLGVFFEKYTQRWRASTTKDRKEHRSRRFKTEEEAARAYNAMALELHGAGARLNVLG